MSLLLLFGQPDRATPATPSIPVTPSMLKGMLDGDSLSSSQIWSVSATNTERRAAGQYTNFAAMAGQPLDVRYAQGYGTSGHSAAEIQSGLAAGVSYAESAGVDYVRLGLGTNDVEGVTSIAALKTIYEDIIDQYLNCTALPKVGINFPGPRGDWEGDTAEVRAGFITRLYDIRTALSELVTQFGANVFTIDAWDVLTDPAVIDATTGLAYFPKTGYYNADGVHLLHKGAHHAAKVEKTAFYAAFNLTNPTSLPTTTGAYNANPTLAGTGGNVGTGASGVVADNCQVVRASGSNISAVCSMVTTTILGVSQRAQKIVISGATAAEEMYFHAQYPINNFAFDGTVGIEFMVPIKIINPVGMKACYLYTRATVGSTYTNKDMALVTGNMVPDDDSDPIEFLARTEPLLIPAGTTTVHNLLVRMPFDGTVASNGAEVYIGQPTAIKKVP